MKAKREPSLKELQDAWERGEDRPDLLAALQETQKTAGIRGGVRMGAGRKPRDYKKITVTLSHDAEGALKKIREKEKKTRSAVLEAALMEYVRKHS